MSVRMIANNIGSMERTGAEKAKLTAVACSADDEV